MKKLARYDVILFDLDGTLSESALGIKFSLEKTIKETGCESFDTNNYHLYIGPPLIDTFKNYCNLKGKEAEKAVEIYRHYYDTQGKLMNNPYDGIKDTLNEIRKTGAKLAVATSKYEKFAEEIVELLGLTPYFDAVCGSLIDGSRKDKKDIIPYAVKTLGFSMNDKIAMVGDTFFDAKGARLCNVDFVGVEYGYGDTESMEREGAVIFAETTADLKKYLI